MIIRAIGNNGALSGTGTVVLENPLLGGVLVTADGANDATIILRLVNSSGKQVFDLVTKAPTFIAAPISLEGNKVLYYDVSGTGAAAMFYEWVE